MFFVIFDQGGYITRRQQNQNRNEKFVVRLGNQNEKDIQQDRLEKYIRLVVQGCGQHDEKDHGYERKQMFHDHIVSQKTLKLAWKQWQQCVCRNNQNQNKDRKQGHIFLKFDYIHLYHK